MSMTDVSGWHEVEQTLTALELPPIPPTSDPQRLLGYVLQILPRYTEMEMLATHLRLYASTLEQDMEQVKSHVQLLTREAVGEREKKHFLERYAAQVVKERNDLLHSRVFSKKKTAAGISHFVWHNCCKKNTSHAMDLAPSILAFRGEKLGEATKQILGLHEEVHNQKLLRKELDFLLKRTQRDHDSKIAADRKHIQQLEKQITQRSALYSSLEKKLYEVEAVLARHDKTKEEELRDVSHRLKEAQECNTSLEKECVFLHEHVKSITSDRDRLLDLLEEATKSKKVLGGQMAKLTEKCQSLDSEVEALRSEIGTLQTKDISDICSQYASRIDKLQKDNAESEKMLRLEVDRLKQELKKRNGSLAQAPNAGLRHIFSSQTNALESISVSVDKVNWSDGLCDDDRRIESNGARLSLSRSQLSSAHESSNLSSSAGRSYFNVSKEVGTDRRIAKSQGRVLCCGSSKPEYSCELDAVSMDGSFSSKSHDDGADITENELFDWETFIDSASEISSLPNDQTNFPSSPISRSIDFSSSAIHYESSPARMSDSVLTENRVDSADLERYHHFADIKECTSFAQVYLSEDEEEKDSGMGVKPLSIKLKQHNEDGTIDVNGVIHEHNTYKESTRNGMHVENDLVRDLSQMLSRLEQKRRKEEQKASQAEMALLEFKQLQQGLQAVRISLNS